MLTASVTLTGKSVRSDPKGLKTDTPVRELLKRWQRHCVLKTYPWKFWECKSYLSGG